MSKHEVALLACKMLAVYFIAQSIVMAGNMALVLTTGPFGANAVLSGFRLRMTIMSLLSAVLHLVVGIVLWRISPSIARRIVADKTDGASSRSEDFKP